VRAPSVRTPSPSVRTPSVRTPSPSVRTTVAPRVNVQPRASVTPRVNTPATPRVNTPATPRVNTTPRVNVAPRANVGTTPRVNPGVTPRTNITPRTNASVTPRIGTPRPGETPRVNSSVRGNVGTNPRTSLRPVTPGANANLGIRGNTAPGVRTPGVRGGGDIRANVNSALNNNRINSPIRSNILPGVTSRPGANVRGDLPGVRGGANIDGRARVDNFFDGRGRVDARGNDGRDGRGFDGRDGRSNDGRGNFAGRNSFRPSWYNNGIYANSRLNNNLGGLIGATIGLTAGRNYLDANVGRRNYWGGYNRPVNQWWGNNRSPYFNNRWWAGRYVYRPYGYFNYNYYQPWGNWWGNPGWAGVNRWYSGYGWNSPYYYDYGTGGNVVYRDNYVYVDGTQVGTAEEYAQSAAALAAVDPAEVPAQATEEWLGLGTFAVVESADPSDRDRIEPSRFVQLAVDKKGFVTGTFFNKKTDETYSLSGRVDKETQRLAFTVDDNKDIVFETGMYNLTQDQTPVLVHLGPSKTETFVFVRLDKPEDNESDRANIEQLP
jgi:hypothetical protein